MGNFKNIQEKLRQFIVKFYTNELIKGAILFVAFGMLYFLITLLIEYYLWLSSTGRMMLFFFFLAVELVLLFRFILIPLAKLVGLRSGLSEHEASKLIGKHFKEVDDRLLNVLQLNQNTEKSELLLASIEQKSANLQPIPFKNAIKFSTNIKYLAYLAIPLVIWLFSTLTGNRSLFNESFTRVVNYKTAYEPPAPFSFVVVNNDLKLIEGETFELLVRTEGEVIPENVSIHFDDQEYLMKDGLTGPFSFSFSNLTSPIEFYVSANGVRSLPYTLEVLRTPRISNFELVLDYPSYTGKQDERLQNTGNTLLPEGTVVRWNILTKSTDTVHFVTDEKTAFTKATSDSFWYSRSIHRPLNYQISTSNTQLKDFEKLNFSIQVVRDAFPMIEVKSDIDSIDRGPIQFAGQLNDDYGLSKLELVVTKKGTAEDELIFPLPIGASTFEEFYYVFSPEDNSDLVQGEDYEMYFKVYDNDGINGAKSVKSKTFSYYQKTDDEMELELLKEQKESMDALGKTGKNTEKLSEEFEEFSKKLRNKPELNWNDKKQFEQFIQRQEQYQEMLDRNTDKLKRNLEDQIEDVKDPSVKAKKEELTKRIEEAQQLQEKDRLLEELRKMSEKLEKEEMIENLEKLTERNKQEKRTLERLLENARRFFVEKKATQIMRKVDSLAKDQEQLSNKIDEENTADEQEKLNEKFDKIEEDFKELREQNEALTKPMDIPGSKKEEESIDKLMEEAKKALEEQEGEEEDGDNEEQEEGEEINKGEEQQSPSSGKQNARKKQKSAAQKLKEMGSKMSQSMEAMQGESIEEDISALRGILENLLSFSFDQEQLMLALEGTDSRDAEYPKYLKRQQVLKEHFEHIDDSIYALALRQAQLSTVVQKDLADAHYNINRSLANIAENRMQQGRSNQQYTMTAANNIAELLSDLLDNLQNASQGGSGGGKSKSSGSGGGFQLPDVIKKQRELSERMKGQMGKGKGEGNGEGEDGENGEKQSGQGGKGSSGEGENENGGEGEDANGELYEIYKEQSRLRQELQDLLEKEGLSGKEQNQGRSTVKKLEELEKQLLDKGFTNEVLEKMQQMDHELLKLEDALKEQGRDTERESTSNTRAFQERTVPPIVGDKLYFNVDEILNRESLPLRANYKRKVQAYFKKKED